MKKLFKNIQKIWENSNRRLMDRPKVPKPKVVPSGQGKRNVINVFIR